MKKLLVVEDEFFVRSMAEIYIEDFGYTASYAEDVTSAHAMMNSDEPFDLLFTDIRLNADIHGGFEIAREAVKHRPGLRVLYTTGGTVTDEMTAMFVQDGGFLQKPYSQSDLQASLKEMLWAVA